MATTVFSDIKAGLKLDASGDIDMVQNEYSIRQSVMTILSTRVGERVMLPKFGSYLHTYLFDPIDSITELLIKDSVRESLTTWENRISIDRVTVIGYEDDNQYQIDVEYTINLNNQQGFFSGRVMAATA